MDTGGKSDKPSKSLTVITSHMNADFDAFASMLAAKKIYPDALVVFPGSQEKNLRDFFVKSMAYMYDIVKVKDVPLDAVARLVLVDTRQASRIGPFAKIIARPDLEIHIYDHHPSMPDDLEGTEETIEMTGATVTIMARILREKELEITPEEATVMALGLYEDTGSFTFASTTEEDYLAGSYLLSKGANLNIVSNMISRELSPEQVNLLNEMIQGATHHTINGVDVVITTVASDTYVADFALLVHKFRDMEALDVVFALATMENRVYLVARSRLPEVDVGEIAMAFGGGGHPSAASASLKGQTAIQARERLFALLKEHINPRRSARDIMSSPVIQVNPKVTLKEANDLLTRYNVNVLVVSESSNLLGIISRQVIEKGLHHKLDNVAVEEYMTTEIDAVESDASLGEIQEKIIGNKQRLLPVTENGEMVGVITRTDLLHILVGDVRSVPDLMQQGQDQGIQVRKKSVSKVLAERLPRGATDILRTVGQVADALGYNAYAVGGFVRDIFLSQDNLDIDVVIEGDGIRFAEALAASLSGRVRAHDKFRTAVVVAPGGWKIDVATSRLEYYKSPGALPTIEMGSLKLDMYRRDFTINTLAVALNPGRFGTLIDFFGGQKDLKAKRITVLHNLSFVEDPTRVFRAVRFEQRFGFRIGKLTSGLIENAVKMDFFKALSGRRVFSELRQILQEEKPIKALNRLAEYNLLKVIHPKLVYDLNLEGLLVSVEKVLTWHSLLFLEEPCRKWVVYLLALIKDFSQREAEDVSERLGLVERYRKILVDDKTEAALCLKWMEAQRTYKNSVLYRRLRRFSSEVLLYMMAGTTKEEVRRAISHYFTRLRPTRTFLKGNDLKMLGFKPGPLYREILETLLDARLNGDLKTREDEIGFVLNRWGSGGKGEERAGL
jgi:tRNA nucleotidyltransferase (CCA-adding enzyme)